jgi:hypothetical protein
VVKPGSYSLSGDFPPRYESGNTESTELRFHACWAMGTARCASSGRSLDGTIYEITWLVLRRQVSLCDSQTYNALKVRFSATLGEEAEGKVALV